MRLQIVDAEALIRIEADLDQPSSELLDRQLSLFDQQGPELDAFRGRLQGAIAAAVVGSVQYELKPPSQAQVRYATVIAAALRVPISPDVLRYRGHMHAFIDQHVDAYRAQLAGQRPAGVKRQANGTGPDGEPPF